MSNATASHPTPEVLTAYGLGKLTAADTEVIAGHLETCLACQQAVADLPPDSFVGKIRAAQPSPASVPGSPATARAETTTPPDTTAAPPEGLPPELASYSKYRFVRELGRGGMGVVYLAEQTLMDRRVAVKVINPGVLAHPSALPRFHAEVRAAATLDHPNIVCAFDAEQVGGLHLLVMEFVEGANLADLVQRKGPLPVAHACHFIRQAALGLQHAFEQGMVHRDIKPQNLMVTPKGHVKILDFGLARLRSGGRGLTEMGSFMGTPEYVSPEQATDARTADTRADLYSLGCTLYFLLTGRPPFPEGTPVKVILAQIEKEAPPVHDLRLEVPRELSAVVARLLAKDPAQRYQQPVELAQVLVPFIKQGAKREGVSLPPLAMPVSECGTALGGNTSRILPVCENPASQAPDAPVAGLAAPAAALKEKHVRPENAEPAAWYRRPPLLAGTVAAVLALGLGAWLLAGVLIKVKTKDGILVVEVNEPDATVLVDGQQVTVAWANGGKQAEIRLQAGTHQLEVKKDGFTVHGDGPVSLEEGGRKVLRVTLEKPPVRPPETLAAKTPDRLTPGSVWTGERAYRKGWWAGITVTYELHVEQRDGAKFTAHVFDNGPGRNRAEVTGEVNGDAITWRERPNHSPDRYTQIEGRFAGDRIRLTLQGRDVNGSTLFEGDGELKLRGTASADVPKILDAAKPDLATADGKGSERRAAEWVLAQGGNVVVRVNGQERKVAAGGTLPAEGFLLEKIDLANKPVIAADLKHLEGLTHLKVLNLIGAGVGDGALVHVQGLGNLSELYLWNCRISDAGLAHLKGLTRLTVLGLYANPGVTDAGLIHLEGLANLANLDLNATRVTDAGLTHLTGLNKLTTLNLMATPVTGAGFVNLKSMQNLEVLFLFRIKVDDGLKHLQGLTKLKYLGLTRTRLNSAGLEPLKTLPNLSGLALDDTQVGDAGMVYLKDLTNLKDLNLRHSAVTGAGLTHFAKLRNLERLILSDCTIRDDDLQGLHGLSQLRELDLSKTKVTAAGVTALKKVLPKCRVTAPDAGGARDKVGGP